MRRYFKSKIPRTRLYIPFPSLVKALMVMLRGGLRDGENVSDFEQKFAMYLNAKYSMTISYARTALFFILKSLNLPSQSEVLMTPITIAEMVNVIHCVGLKPVFVDIELNSFNVDIEDIEKKVTKKSKVLLVTHLFGITPDMEKIVTVAKKYDLILIEDFSQSFGCKYRGKYLGTFGLVGFCSLSWIKTVSTFYGGVVITDNSEFIDRIKKSMQGIIHHGKAIFFITIIVKSIILSIATNKYVFSFLTYYFLRFLRKISPRIVLSVMSGNEPPVLRESLPKKWFYQFNILQAKTGLDVLQKVRSNDEKRIQNVNVLLGNLSPEARRHFTQMYENTYNIYWRLPCIAKDISVLQEYLFKNGIDNCETTLPVCSELEVFSLFKSKTPHAVFLKKNTTFIPIHPTLNNNDMFYIAKLLNNYFGKE